MARQRLEERPTETCSRLTPLRRNPGTRSHQLHTTPITAALTLPMVATLHHGDSVSTQIAVELSYTASDPYAITLTLRLHRHAVPWVFARVLLSRGLVTPTGDGDVHIWPDHNEAGDAVVTIELCPRRGHALIDLPATEALDFTVRTYALVAAGHEGRHLDIDAALAAIRATDTS